MDEALSSFFRDLHESRDYMHPGSNPTIHALHLLRDESLLPPDWPGIGAIQTNMNESSTVVADRNSYRSSRLSSKEQHRRPTSSHRDAGSTTTPKQTVSNMQPDDYNDTDMSLRNTATDKVSKKWSLHNPEKQLRQFDRKDDDSMNAIVERSSRAESLDELLWDAVKELGLGDVPHDIVNKMLMGDITKPKEYLEGVAASIKSISCFESEWKTGPSW